MYVCVYVVSTIRDTHTCTVSTVTVHTHMHIDTHWVSRNRSLVIPLMNPSVILQLNYGRVSSQGTPLRTAWVTWQPDLSLPKSSPSPYLSLVRPLCFLAQSCLNSLHYKVSLSLTLSLFFSLIPYAQWGMSCSRHVWVVRHIATNLCHHILISSFHFLCVYQSVSVLDIQ